LYVVSEGEDLVARCQRGDHAAFAELFDTHKTDVARIVYRFVGASADLEDLVQDVFVQVYRSIGKFKGNARFSTWLYRVAVNVALMHKRAQQSRPRLVDEDRGPVPEELHTPEDEAARNLRVSAFRWVLELLSE
jgi:RNA polymerase sigma-70 factor (ECF subfamily)